MIRANYNVNINMIITMININCKQLFDNNNNSFRSSI